MALDRLVVDASVAAKWFLITGIYAGEADALLRNEWSLLVPDLIFPEVGNIVWKHVRKGTLPDAEAVNIVTTLGHLRLLVCPSYPLVTAAVEIACKTSRTVYDCLYLALAVQEGSAVVTADEKLRNALLGTQYSRHILWIADVV